MNRTTVVGLVGVAAAVLAACSSSKTGPSKSTLAASHVAATSSTPAASASSAPPASTPGTSAAHSSATRAAALSGTWKGTYSGSYSGTFVLHWVQSAGRLTGTIDLSSAPGAQTIDGSVAGGTIRFGTVGSQAISYTGSVSGGAMSGKYEVAGGAAGTGSWSASRA